MSGEAPAAGRQPSDRGRGAPGDDRARHDLRRASRDWSALCFSRWPRRSCRARRVRLEPLALRHVTTWPGRRRDRGSYAGTWVPTAGEVAGYVDRQLARPRRAARAVRPGLLASGRAVGVTAFWDPRPFPDRAGSPRSMSASPGWPRRPRAPASTPRPSPAVPRTLSSNGGFAGRAEHRRPQRPLPHGDRRSRRPFRGRAAQLVASWVPGEEAAARLRALLGDRRGVAGVPGTPPGATGAGQAQRRDLTVASARIPAHASPLPVAVPGRPAAADPPLPAPGPGSVPATQDDCSAGARPGVPRRRRRRPDGSTWQVPSICGAKPDGRPRTAAGAAWAWPRKSLPT